MISQLEKESQKKVGILRDQTMSQVELIWGAFSLMIMGALLTMCMKCQRSVSGLEHVKKSCKIPGPREPIRADYYNCRQFFRPPNVLAEADVYENSTAIQLWKHSCVSESSTDDEPDYINAEVVCKPDSSFFA
ncbi:hypothetical protein lerEdw1_004825 [Lerista edwardsae]|nr:hypothetical protein lerEdw1_004825 [Lerista edwardsae]